MIQKIMTATLKTVINEKGNNDDILVRLSLNGVTRQTKRDTREDIYGIAIDTDDGNIITFWHWRDENGQFTDCVYFVDLDSNVQDAIFNKVMADHGVELFANRK
jgi:hypothetical protein